MGNTDVELIEGKKTEEIKDMDFTVRITITRPDITTNEYADKLKELAKDLEPTAIWALVRGLEDAIRKI